MLLLYRANTNISGSESCCMSLFVHHGPFIIRPSAWQFLKKLAVNQDVPICSTIECDSSNLHFGCRIRGPAYIPANVKQPDSPPLLMDTSLVFRRSTWERLSPPFAELGPYSVYD